MMRDGVTEEPDQLDTAGFFFEQHAHPIEQVMILISGRTIASPVSANRPRSGGSSA
jgi:hypothetical protein